MFQITHTKLCLVSLALIWYGPGYSSSLSRQARSAGNPGTTLTAQPCPANQKVSVVNPEPESTDSAVAYLLLTSANSNFTSEQTKKLEDAYTYWMTKDGTDLCSKDKVLAKNIAVELRSDCPFIWTKNVKPDRFPEVLMEAKCLCEQPKTKPTWENWQTGVQVACEEVKYKVPVLWRELCDQKVYMYRLGYDTTSVGCVRTISSLEDPGTLVNLFKGSRLR